MPGAVQPRTLRRRGRRVGQRQVVRGPGRDLTPVDRRGGRATRGPARTSTAERRVSRGTTRRSSSSTSSRNWSRCATTPWSGRPSSTRSSLIPADSSSPCEPTCTASSVPSPSWPTGWRRAKCSSGRSPTPTWYVPCRNRPDDAGSMSRKALPRSSPPSSAKRPARCRCSVTPSARRGCAEKAGPITVAGYRASGGVRSAIATTAEQALAALDENGQAVARRVLLRMVQLRPEGEDTRRWASRREITDVDPQRTDDVIAALTNSRLLVVDHDQITVAHEALLSRLATPQRVDRRRTRRPHRATKSSERPAERWATGGHNDADLYRGLRLDRAIDLTRRDGLSGQEREFVEAGRLLRDRRTHRGATHGPAGCESSPPSPLCSPSSPSPSESSPSSSEPTPNRPAPRPTSGGDRRRAATAGFTGRAAHRAGERSGRRRARPGVAARRRGSPAQ